MCKLHYQRWAKHGDPRVRLSKWQMSEPDRFWSYVEKVEDGCWVWLGGTKNGYGNFSVTRDGNDRMVQAHRYAYEITVGPIGVGMTLDHLCHTRAVDDCRTGSSCVHRRCVNPDHLEPVSLLENIQRGGNGTKTHCKRGHEFTPENTWLDKRNGRYCRACMRLRAANYRARRSAQQPWP